jgi:hypothetical protein
MLSEITGLMTFNAQCQTPLIGLRLRDWLLAFVLALGCAALAGPAFGGAVFDGDWSVLIVTHGGACDPAYRYGVQITDGTVINDGSSAATVQGRVTPSGAVRVIVRSGNQWADGSGRLSRNHGRGAWSGQGTSGTCSGIWEAERRE